MSTPRRGRPALDWLDGPALAALPHGTAVSLELHGGHRERLIGRVTGHIAGALELDTTSAGEVAVDTIRIKRGRVVPALYEPGDAVLQRHVTASAWRGGVVRCDGRHVLVEQIDGTFAWFLESELEPAEARSALPPLPRGPVPAALR